MRDETVNRKKTARSAPILQADASDGPCQAGL